MKDCLFCKLMQSEKQKKLYVYNDNEFVVFPDISQFTIGHLLVTPKHHYRFIWDIPNIGKYFEVCRKISLHLQKVLAIDQVYVLVMGSMVPHAHIHLIPKTSGNWYQALQTIGQLQKNKTEYQKLEALVNKIKLPQNP